MTQQKPVSVSGEEVSVSGSAVEAVSQSGARASAQGSGEASGKAGARASGKAAARAAGKPAAKAAAQPPAKLVSSNGSAPAQVPTQAPVIPLPTKTVAGASGVRQTSVSKPSFLSKYGFILSLF